ILQFTYLGYNKQETLTIGGNSLSLTTAFIKIGSLVFSLLIGIVFFYITNQSTKQEKKQQLDQFISYLINFILFIWAGKIIIHISIFFQDPFAVLAYASDSRSVYIATILLVLQLIYRKIRKQLSVSQLVNTMIPIFLATSFIYERSEERRVGKSIDDGRRCDS